MRTPVVLPSIIDTIDREIKSFSPNVLTAHNPRTADVLDIRGGGYNGASAMAEVEAMAKRERRRARYKALNFLRTRSGLNGIRGCSWARIDPQKPVQVYRNSKGAYFGNLRRCGGVHACPTCAPVVRQRRAAEIEHGLRAHREAGGGVEFVTFTLQHNDGELLASQLELVAHGFRFVCGNGSNARAWALQRAVIEDVGRIRTLEVTHGANGWHAHLHVLFLTARPLDAWTRADLYEYLFESWQTFLARRGRTVTREHGVVGVPVVSDVDVARYMSKVYDQLHHEMTRLDLKRGVGRNPFRILADVMRDGDVSPTTGEVNVDWLRWREYEKATKGRQFLTWSAGLKSRFAVDELTDVELLDQEQGGELVGEIPLWAWWSVRVQPWRLSSILDAAERHGEAGLYELLDALPPPPARVA